MLISEYEIDKDDCDQGDVGQVLLKTNYNLTLGWYLSWKTSLERMFVTISNWLNWQEKFDQRSVWAERNEEIVDRLFEFWLRSRGENEASTAPLHNKRSWRNWNSFAGFLVTFNSENFFIGLITFYWTWRGGWVEHCITVWKLNSEWW